MRKLIDIDILTEALVESQMPIIPLNNVVSFYIRTPKKTFLAFPLWYFWEILDELIGDNTYDAKKSCISYKQDFIRLTFYNTPTNLEAVKNKLFVGEKSEEDKLEVKSFKDIAEFLAAVFYGNLSNEDSFIQSELESYMDELPEIRAIREKLESGFIDHGELHAKLFRFQSHFKVSIGYKVNVSELEAARTTDSEEAKKWNIKLENKTKDK